MRSDVNESSKLRIVTKLTSVRSLIVWIFETPGFNSSLFFCSFEYSVGKFFWKQSKGLRLIKYRFLDKFIFSNHSIIILGNLAISQRHHNR